MELWIGLRINLSLEILKFSLPYLSIHSLTIITLVARVWGGDAINSRASTLHYYNSSVITNFSKCNFAYLELPIL